jgi:peroxiredoxin
MKPTLLLGILALGTLASISRTMARTDSNQAPEFVGGPWLNTKDGKPVTIASRHGKITLVAFWTYGCINCRHNLEPYERLLAKYRPKGVELLSVHTPELQEEHDVHLLAKHIEKFKIDYPVLVDNGEANWKRWGLSFWPSLYVVDGAGIVRYHWFGELNYGNAGGEAKIAEILDKLLAGLPLTSGGN